MMVVSMRGVVEAGPCLRSLQIDYDDEVEYRGIQCLYDLARAPEKQPFLLTVSFTHPHPPFTAPQKFWDLYNEADIDMPKVDPIPFGELDKHSQWLYTAHAQDQHKMTDERIRNARHAYYGMISYVDEKVGSIVNTLKEVGLDQDTLIVLAGDHGEMLGERGMWYKQTFFENSVRVPLIISMPSHFKHHRVSTHVSLVDLLPTFIDIANPDGNAKIIDDLDGKSLIPLLDKSNQNDERIVISEYSSEGVCAASRMVRKGKYKYIYTYGLPPMLFNLEADPSELFNLAGNHDYEKVESDLYQIAIHHWDPKSVHDAILASQKRRLFISRLPESLDPIPNWAYQPFIDESKHYIRGSGVAGPTGTKSKARFPYVKPVEPDQ